MASMFGEGLHFSVSQIKAYLLCPRQYELRYVRAERPAFVPVPLAFGTAFHAALGFFYGIIGATKAVPSLAEVEQVFADAWENAASGPVPLQGEPDDTGSDPLARARQMLSVFYDAVTQGHPPEVQAVEQQFTVELHDPDTGAPLEEQLVGVFDLVVKEETRAIIVEHKSAAKRWSADQLRHDLQASAYKYAATRLGLGDVGLRLQVITKAKSPSLQIEDLRRGAADEEDFLRVAVGVLRAIDARAFWPNRGWQCRSCPYGTACSRR
jgi:CRISPR/Cas system-associated exonuclease Cas4 (RecB family)